MKIDFPEHEIGPWLYTPWWMIWRPKMRRRHWRWTVDWNGCRNVEKWQYRD